MTTLYERLETIPYLGFLLICQLYAFTMAAGIPDGPRSKVKTVQWNGNDLDVFLDWERNDGIVSGGAGGIRIVTQPVPRLVLSGTRGSLIGGYEHKPSGLIVVFLIGLPTVILLLPVVLTIRAILHGYAWSEGMDPRAALTFFHIRSQLEPDAREVVRIAFQNARLGDTVERADLNL